MDLKHESESVEPLGTRADHSETTSARIVDGSGKSFILSGERPDSVEESEGVKQSDGGVTESIREPEAKLAVLDASGSGKSLDDLGETERTSRSRTRISSSLSSASFSSLSDLSIDQVLQVVTNESSVKSLEQDIVDDYERSISSESSSKSAELGAGILDPELTLETAGKTTAHDMPPPLLQAMEQPQGYDPFRIPASVFESKSATPVEWSIASNESLFSLHVGNASFSRDRASTLGDLTKSGELSLFDEATLLASAAGIHGKELESEEESASAEGSIGKALEEVTRLIKGHSSAKRVPPQTALSNSSSRSRLSDGSDNSTRSFAFPILPGGMTNESIRPEMMKLRPEAAATARRRTSKSSFANRWLPCLSWCGCLSWCSCSWPRNCSCRRHCCRFSCRRRCCCSRSSCSSCCCV